ncbi:hypothetical protein [Pendulispora rubella]
MPRWFSFVDESDRVVRRPRGDVRTSSCGTTGAVSKYDVLR